MESEHDAFVAYKELQGKVISPIYIYDYVDHVNIYHNNDKLSSIGELILKSEFDVSPLVDNYLESNKSLFIDSDEEFIKVYRKLNAINLASKNYIEISLSDQLLGPYLKENLVTSYNGNTYLVNDSNQIIASSDDKFDYSTVMNAKDLLIAPTQIKLTKSFVYGDGMMNWKLVTVMNKPTILINQRNKFIQLGLVGGLIFSLTTILSIFIGQSISGRLEVLHKGMEQNDENSLNEIEMDLGGDEVGRTVFKYNEMVKRINSLIYELKKEKINSTELLHDRLKAFEELEIINEELATVNMELSTTSKAVQVQDNRINELVYKDELTGLSNRFAIYNTIKLAVETNVLKLPMAVMIWDLDDFNKIAKTQGHEIADQVIVDIGRKLLDLETTLVSISRVGVNVFMILIRDDQTLNSITNVIDQIHKLLYEPIEIGGRKLYISASTGISYFPKDATNHKELIKKANKALEVAKEIGRNQCIIYDEAIAGDIDHKHSIKDEMNQAFLDRDFYPSYQPIVNATTKEVSLLEASVNWNNVLLKG